MKTFTETANFLLARVPRFYAAILRRKRRSSFEKILFLSLVRNSDTVLDIGAHRGYYTLLFSHIVGPMGRIHAFEPIPPTFSRLEKFLHQHHRFSNFHLNKIALGESSGRLTMYLPYPDEAQASIAIHQAGSWACAERIVTYDCEVARLDDYSEHAMKSRLDFIKCDTEGAEFSILKGGMETLSRYRPILYLEIYQAWAKTFGYEPIDLVRLLSPVGYSDFYLVENGLRLLRDPERELSEDRFVNPSNLLCLMPKLHGERLHGLG